MYENLLPNAGCWCLGVKVREIFYKLPSTINQCFLFFYETPMNFKENPAFCSVFDWFRPAFGVQQPTAGRNTQHRTTSAPSTTIVSTCLHYKLFSASQIYKFTPILTGTHSITVCVNLEFVIFD